MHAEAKAPPLYTLRLPVSPRKKGPWGSCAKPVRALQEKKISPKAQSDRMISSHYLLADSTGLLNA